MEMRPSKEDKKYTPEVELKPLPSHLRIKEALVTAPIIQSPDWSLPFKTMCDARDMWLGGFRVTKRQEALYYLLC